MSIPLKVSLAILIWLWFSDVSAHPPYRIAIDSSGRVFFSDLQNVWMLLADGSRIIAVRGVHTHELWVDSSDNLYGEDVRNQGDDYQHRIWKRSPDGEIIDVIAWRAGFPYDYLDRSVVLDSQGRSIFLRKSDGKLVVTAAGAITREISLDNLGTHIHEFVIGPGDVIYVAVGRTIYRVNEETDDVVPYFRVPGVFSQHFDFVHERHALMGMWMDQSNHLYVADFAGQRVVRVDKSGKTEVVSRLDDQYSTVAGIVDDDGHVWLQDFSVSNETRIRRISPEGVVTVY